jgi:hypothetical protein
MNKFQKLSQLNRDIELLENAGKIKAAEVLHRKFIKEAQYAMPAPMPVAYNPMPTPMPVAYNPMPAPMPFAYNPAAYRPVTYQQPAVRMPTMQGTQAVTPVTTNTTAPKTAPVQTGKQAPPPTSGSVQPPYEGSNTNPGGQVTPPGKPTDGGNYLMNPGEGGKTVFTDPRTGYQTDPPGSDQQFDYYYGKIQEAYRLDEPQKSQMLKNLFNQIRQRGDKLGGRLQGSLLNQYFDGSGKPLY